ncbi:MAG: hypothetical protein ACKOSQ_04565 [Planctomycetaceae bacterium]
MSPRPRGTTDPDAGMMSPFTSEQARLRAVVRALAVAMLLCLACAWRLWLSTRLYPLVPVLGLVPRFPWPLDALVLALLVGLLAGLVARPLSRPLVAGAVGLLAVLFAQDQSRLWPSFYEFFLLLIMLLAHRPDRGEAEATRTLDGMRFVVAAAYFWGGVQKLNVHFFHEEFPWFVRPLTDLLPGPVPGLPVLGAAAAVFETLFGIGLLTRRFRGIALGDALVMHAVILVCIGPLRGDWNDSAWMWSLGSAALAWLLFRAAPPFSPRTMLAAPPPHGLPQAAAVVLVGFLPLLNNLNLWDSALSFNVYTGNVSAAHVIMPAGSAARLPRAIAVHAISADDREILDLDAWAMAEFNANTYPEPRIFRALFAEICGRLPGRSARLVIVEKAGWFAPQRTRVLECGER